MALTFNPCDPNLLRDPYPLYRELRTHAPVHRVPAHGWLVTRHADVVAVLRDKRFRMAQGPPPGADEPTKAGPLERMLQLRHPSLPQPFPKRAQRLHTFLDQLVERGLCTPAKLVRDVHHLKWVCHPEGRIKAKAYLSAGHRWHRGAAPE